MDIKPGDRVIETSMSCQQGDEGTVYRGEREERQSFGHLLVRWDDGMHTALTGGSKLVSEIEPEELARLREMSRKRIRS